MEAGETGEQAAAREIREETGLNVPLEAFQPFCTLPNQYLFQDFVWPTRCRWTSLPFPRMRRPCGVWRCSQRVLHSSY
jgi:8-oxo-dGTP pyrophosphatase MutT (NUDIX family)